MAQSLETADIFRSAYFLCNGGSLSGINIKEGGRRIAIFVIQGEGGPGKPGAVQGIADALAGHPV
jgi:hypothetical protein